MTVKSFYTKTMEVPHSWGFCYWSLRFLLYLTFRGLALYLSYNELKRQKILFRLYVLVTLEKLRLAFLENLIRPECQV